MEDLQIRRGWFDQAKPVPPFYALDNGKRRSHFDRRDHWQCDVVNNRFVVIESNLAALAPGLLLGWGLFRFAVAVRRATAFRALPHEVVIA
jgi:hypothetical protein